MKRYESEVQALRAKIKGLQVEGTALQKKITKTTGPKRHQLRVKKADLGTYARYSLLAYALFRGKTYMSTEGSCKSKPDAKRLLRELEAHTSLMWTTKEWNGKTYSCVVPWTLEAVKEWLCAAVSETKTGVEVSDAAE